MPSEYHKWLARNEKPAEKRELTKAEKRRNWWHYHKWYVIIGVAALAFVVIMIADAVSANRNQPDYQLAYVGSAALPEDTVSALEAALAQYGEDLNGNGEVRVQVNQYIFYEGKAALDGNQSARMQLMVDATHCTSFIYLMEDPQSIQKTYELLAYPDGSEPPMGAEPDAALWLAWTDCPALAGLELGSYSKVVGQQTLTGESQQLFSGISVARRITPMGGFDTLSENEAFWQKLIAGAK